MRDVLIIGGGPVGLFLATLLAKAGVNVAIWEQRPAAVQHSRAIGIHAPALDALHQAGVRDAVVDEAVLIRRGVAISAGRRLGTVSFDHVSKRNPFVAVLPQHETEAILAHRLIEVGGPILVRGLTLTDLRESGGHLDVVGYSGTTSLAVHEQARFVIGADGARSTVRELIGIGTSGREYPDTYVMGDYTDLTAAGPEAQVFLESAGVVESFPLPHGRRRFVVRTDNLVHDPAPEHLAEVVRHRTGLSVDAANCSMVSAFGVRRRLAHAMVHGRTVLVGDAAHEISPIGGQGMNLGWLDAAALAPLLVQVLRSRTLEPSTFDGFDAFERDRMSSARGAVRTSEANMKLGRPVSGAQRAVRDLAIRGVLNSGLARPLASRYAMTRE